MSYALTDSLSLPCGGIISNRLAKSATQDGLAVPYCHASPELCTLYERWSRGGAGLLISGDIMVDGDHLERPGNVVIDRNGGLDQLRKWATAGRVAGNHFWMQINHPGRQTPVRFNKNPLAPSATQDGIPARAFGWPRAMTEEDIWEVIRRFGRAAAVARETGFTGVQLHAAHGFLISQFLSPLANQRQDGWGGTLKNRARLLIESIRAIRREVGDDFPISVKLNSADFQKGGFDVEESVKVAEMLNQTSLDLLEISGGNAGNPVMLGGTASADQPPHGKASSTLRREGYFAEYAKRVRPAAGMPIMITGGFRSREVMEKALCAGITDLIGMARPLCVATDLCAKLLSGEISRVPAVEETLLLDRARFGAEIDDTAFNHITSYSQLAWMYLQVARLANNDLADLSLDIESAVERLEKIEDEREAARLHAAAAG